MSANAVTQNIQGSISLGGSVVCGFCYGCWQWPCKCHSTGGYYTTGYVQVIDEPKTCIGKAHVFECDHVETCQCGKVQRVMPMAAAPNKVRR